MLGRTEGRRIRGRLKEHELEQTPGDGEGQGGLLQSMGVQRVRHDFVTEQQEEKAALVLNFKTEDNNKMLRVNGDGRSWLVFRK